jgi:hypothetical protein
VHTRSHCLVDFSPTKMPYSCVPRDLMYLAIAHKMRFTRGG